LRAAFEKLGFKGNKRFIYNILSELDNDFSGGIEFDEFLKISTSKISDKDSKKEV
jgi:centrin-1